MLATMTFWAAKAKLFTICLDRNKSLTPGLEHHQSSDVLLPPRSRAGLPLLLRGNCRSKFWVYHYLAYLKQIIIAAHMYPFTICYMVLVAFLKETFYGSTPIEKCTNHKFTACRMFIKEW